MSKFAIAAILMIWSFGASIAVTAQSGTPGSAAAELRVMPGDTLINLFGDDWRKVYELNRCECRFSPNITDVNDPNFIYAGSSLIVATNVHLTERALDRLAFVKSERDNLRSRLESLIQAGGDVAISAERLYGQLDAAISVDDLSNLDSATVELENAEVHVAVQESTDVWIIIGSAAFALLVTILLMWAWRNHAADGSRRLDAALEMVNTIAG